MERKTFNEWWNEIGEIFSYGDIIESDINELGDEIVVFRNSCGCVLSIYNRNAGTVMRY